MIAPKSLITTPIGSKIYSNITPQKSNRNLQFSSIILIIKLFLSENEARRTHKTLHFQFISSQETTIRAYMSFTLQRHPVHRQYSHRFFFFLQESVYDFYAICIKEDRIDSEFI